MSCFGDGFKGCSLRSGCTVVSGTGIDVEKVGKGLNHGAVGAKGLETRPRMSFMLGFYSLSRNSEDRGDLLILRNSLAEIPKMGILRNENLIRPRFPDRPRE